MANTMLLIGTEDVTRAANRMAEAADKMQSAAAEMDYAFQQRRQWEEEYLARIEAIVNKELDFYAEAKIATLSTRAPHQKEQDQSRADSPS